MFSRLLPEVRQAFRRRQFHPSYAFSRRLIPLFGNADQTIDSPSLGRIVVHDRVQVESTVLPRYFNHSSFASLRRQLNYFCFVRLGKGRQRESTYVNENVIQLDDILHLKRRSATGNVSPENCDSSVKHRRFGSDCTFSNRADGMDAGVRGPVLSASSSFCSFELASKHRHKRRRLFVVPQSVSPRSASPVENNPISEDDESFSREQFIVLDLTKPEFRAEEDVIAGCEGLLYLASKTC